MVKVVSFRNIELIACVINYNLALFFLEGTFWANGEAEYFVSLSILARMLGLRVYIS